MVEGSGQVVFLRTRYYVDLGRFTSCFWLTVLFQSLPLIDSVIIFQTQRYFVSALFCGNEPNYDFFVAWRKQIFIPQT